MITWNYLKLLEPSKIPVTMLLEHNLDKDVFHHFRETFELMIVIENNAIFISLENKRLKFLKFLRFILNPTSGLATMTLITRETGSGVTVWRHRTPTGTTSHLTTAVCHAQLLPAPGNGTMNRARASLASFVRNQVSPMNQVNDQKTCS